MSTSDIQFPDGNDRASVPVTIRLESHEVEKLAALAREDHRTRSSFLRLMVLKGVEVFQKENQRP